MSDLCFLLAAFPAKTTSYLLVEKLSVSNQVYFERRMMELNKGPPAILDRQGGLYAHVGLIRPKRAFSLFGLHLGADVNAEQR